MFLLLAKRLAVVAGVVALLLPAVLCACPFCSAVSQTFTEEMNTVDVAVIARLVAPAAPNRAIEQGDSFRLPTEFEKTKFEIIQVLKGEQALGKTKQIEVLFFGQQPKDTKFLIMGVEPPQIAWNAPVPITERAVTYLGKLLSLPEKGAPRLKFFQEHLEDADEMLARDAYDEFAKAPYPDVKALGPHMKHDQLMAWIQDKSVLASRRRLYLTMLGVCGNEADTKVLEEMITREEPAGEPKLALDAMIACYLTLKGPAGMPLIVDHFLKNADAQYADTYAAIMALRFHGQEEKIVPKEKLIEGLRHMLDRPKMADLVIPDLARWQDWSSMPKLVELFKNANEESSWVRVPVVQFLRACPLPEAKEQIAALQKIDPEAVKRASFFVPIGGGAPMPPKKGPEIATKNDALPAPPAAVEGPVKGAAAKDAPAADAPPKAAADPAEKPAAAKTEVQPSAASAEGPTTPALLPPPSATSDSSAPATKSPAAAATTVASSNQPPQPPAQAPASPASPETANSPLLVGVPAGVGVVLFVLLLIILRGVGGEVVKERGLAPPART